jgi:8-oxo-dGTP pyrophosphatase MutT (NUDIX family)
MRPGGDFSPRGLAGRAAAEYLGKVRNPNPIREGPHALDERWMHLRAARGLCAADGRRVSVPPWRLEASRHALDERWMRLRADRWVTPGGAVLDPWYVQERPDWVHVLALTPDDHILLVRQWRPGIGAAMLELPGGIMEPEDADPVAAAAREFREETGHAAPAYRLFLSGATDPAHATNRIHFVLALGAVPLGPTVLDHGEELVLERLPVTDVLAGLAGGLIGNATHAGAILPGLLAAGRISLAAG